MRLVEGLQSSTARGALSRPTAMRLAVAATAASSALGLLHTGHSWPVAPAKVTVIDASRQLPHLPHHPPAATPATSRQGFLQGLTCVGLTYALQSPIPAVAAAEPPAPAVTARAFFEVRFMEPLTEANGYSSSSAPTGKLVFELFGQDAPRTVESFLSYLLPPPPAKAPAQDSFDEAAGDTTETSPSYASSLFTRLEPGKFVEAGKISGLNAIELAGSSQLQYYGRIFPAAPSLESNALRHTTRGLLSKGKLQAGSEFAITLGACPELDASNVVFGRVVEGGDVLSALEAVPVYASGSTQQEGSLADNWYRAQKSASLYVGKNVLRDQRAVDRSGTFLRRVDVLRCGSL